MVWLICDYQFTQFYGIKYEEKNPLFLFLPNILVLHKYQPTLDFINFNKFYQFQCISELVMTLNMFIKWKKLSVNFNIYVYIIYYIENTKKESW